MASSLATVLALQIAVTHLAPLQQLFDTTSIIIADWIICALVASTGPWIEEGREHIRRNRTRSPSSEMSRLPHHHTRHDGPIGHRDRLLP